LEGIHVEVDIEPQANPRPGRLLLESDLTHIPVPVQGTFDKWKTWFAFLYRFFISKTIE
jgi:hypothetical protein